MESTIGKRIRQLREAKGLSVADFAKCAGVKPSAIYGLESDANKPSIETVAMLRQSFPDLNSEWLQFGDGPMLRDGRALTPTDLAKFPERVPLRVETPTAEQHLWINKEGALEGGPAGLIAELRGRLADKDLEIERLVDQLTAWQEAYRKPLASSYAAAAALPSPCRPIGPRFDEPEPTMFVSYRQAVA